MNYEDRPYQLKLIEDVKAELRNGKRRILMQLPTGGGKTFIAARIAKGTADKGNTVWFLVHRDFLVAQTAATFTEFAIPHGLIVAKGSTGLESTMVVAIDTLRARMAKIKYHKPRVVFWDECHHIKAATWAKIFEWFGPDCTHLGMTATPQRLDGRGLSPPFEVMVQGPTTGELMAMGYLCQYRAYAPSGLDLSNVDMVAGDYNQAQLSDEVERSVIVGDVVGHYQRLAASRRALYFCVSLPFSRRLVSAFSARGIPALHLDADSNKEERAQAARALASGAVKVLCNVGLFGEGYDLEAQAGEPVTVEAVGLVRPTMSLSLHLQQLGRGMRPKPEPAIFLDHAGNIERHGLPDSPRDWTLAGRVRNAERKLVKECKACGAINKVTAVVCEACLAPFPKAPREEPDHIEGILEEVDAKAFNARIEEIRQAKYIRARREELVAAAKTYAELEALAKLWDYKPGWAWYVYQARREKEMRDLRWPNEPK
jgi:DNA repair protein RadD